MSHFTSEIRSHPNCGCTRSSKSGCGISLRTCLCLTIASTVQSGKSQRRYYPSATATSIQANLYGARQLGVMGNLSAQSQGNHTSHFQASSMVHPRGSIEQMLRALIHQSSANTFQISFGSLQSKLLREIKRVKTSRMMTARPLLPCRLVLRCQCNHHPRTIILPIFRNTMAARHA